MPDAQRSTDAALCTRSSVAPHNTACQQAQHAQQHPAHTLDLRMSWSMAGVRLAAAAAAGSAAATSLSEPDSISLPFSPAWCSSGMTYGTADGTGQQDLWVVSGRPRRGPSLRPGASFASHVANKRLVEAGSSAAVHGEAASARATAKPPSRPTSPTLPTHLGLLQLLPVTCHLALDQGHADQAGDQGATSGCRRVDGRCRGGAG